MSASSDERPEAAKALDRKEDEHARLRSCAFTLAELAASMAIMVILMGAMGSVIMLAGQAIPDAADPGRRKVAAMEAVDQLAAELFYATAITEASPNAVTFTVADRGHGAAGPETIRYAWSGTPGHALTRQYNGGTAVSVFEGVKLLHLSYEKRVGQLQGPPKVLLIVEDDVTPSAEDVARRQQIESWGFTVQLIDPYRTDAEYTAAVDTADVMYWSEEHMSPPPWWVFDAPRGIVCEKRDSWGVLGISSGSNWTWLRSINILDNAHEITKPFALGNLRIFSTDDYAVYSWGTIAPGGEILASSTGYNMMVAVDLNAELHTGAAAAARRVSLPWGDRTFDFNVVTSEGLTLMRRAIAWAAAPAVYSGVRIALSHHKDTDLIRTRVQVYNAPKVSVP